MDCMMYNRWHLMEPSAEADMVSQQDRDVVENQLGVLQQHVDRGSSGAMYGADTASMPLR